MTKTIVPVLLQNDDFLAVDKPPGISVHNNEDPENLLQLLEKQLGKNKLFPVHRLDKETSGVQILAFNEVAAKNLAEEFQKKSVEKIYIGLLRRTMKVSEGVWNHPLTDKSEGRKNPAGIAKSRFPCETRFRVLKTSEFFSLCEFQLITGRQHQIRKHSALANHAIVGDPRYNDQNYNLKMADVYGISRMFLHCHRVKILSHTIESPMPFDFNVMFN